MKLRTTTPASISSAAKVALIFTSVLVLVAVPLQMTKNASADQYDDKIAALQRDIARYQAEGAKLNKQANTLRSALAQIANQKAAIQAQINISQAKHDKLVADVAETEEKIQNNKDALGVILAEKYIDEDITPIEQLASSKNLSEFGDKAEYRASIQNELDSIIEEMKKHKEQLSRDKAKLEKVMADQKSQRDQLAAKEGEQQALLSRTQGQEAGYQRLIANSEDAIAEARATQALLNSRISGSGGFTLVDSGSMGGYPWNASNCPMMGYLSTGGADGNGSDGYGYGCRQCASYVAWRIAKETGKYYSWGNAVNFTQNAINAGYQAGGPKAGSIAVMDPYKAGQSYGHVAWVEAVSGNMILISQYNYDYGAGYGMYSKMWLSSSAFDHYVHIK